ncbi:hypothetical protein PCASD_19176 [Puccinia coronata f. sp. avenae]|uniref:Uncharacterized protein n=1 Tax=Puccinia coronata f. sp. avenae TaxID=200324 RepID=A0A2N5TY76_9BASI|nr:hypothetical protein PCASD_19176 [Puccinia coronata f. sp. avenae]
MGNLHIPPFDNHCYRDTKTSVSSASSLQPFNQEEYTAPPNPPNSPNSGPHNSGPHNSGPHNSGTQNHYNTFQTQPPSERHSTHFLDQVVSLPAYNPTPFVRRVIKIKPTKKDLHFNGTKMEILDFIQELENAAMQDGAQAEDIATQISSFITNKNILKEVKDMSGKIKNDWELLKYQMVQQWSKMMPLMKYTRENLDNLIFKARTDGGIQTFKQFQDFSTKVDTIVNYLVRCRHMANIEEIRHSVLNCLTPTIRLAVNKELIRDNQMDVAIDGSYLLPPYKTIIQYIHKELKTMSILEMEEDVFKKAVNDKNQTTQRTTQIPTQSAPVKDQEVEQLTKSLSSWNAQKQPTTFYQSSNVLYQPAQNIKPPEQQFCQYCYMRGHPTGRCNLANYDEIQGLVKREGRDLKLPDGSTIPWERNRPYKMAVDQFHSKTSQQGIIQLPPQTQTQNPEQKVPEVQISFGILEEMETTCNLECDSHKDYVSEILPTHSVITPAFTLEENSQLESIDQSQEASQGHRITKLEGTSTEHSPVMAIVDSQELEQSNYKSIIPPEKSECNTQKNQSLKNPKFQINHLL